MKPQPAPAGANTVPIASVVIGERHRKDMGDLDALARSIETEGLLQPIGITESKELVFGERRLRACRDVLRREKIEARVVAVTSILAGEYAGLDPQRSGTREKDGAHRSVFRTADERQFAAHGRRCFERRKAMTKDDLGANERELLDFLRRAEPGASLMIMIGDRVTIEMRSPAMSKEISMPASTRYVGEAHTFDDAWTDMCVAELRQPPTDNELASMQPVEGAPGLKVSRVPLRLHGRPALRIVAKGRAE